MLRCYLKQPILFLRGVTLSVIINQLVSMLWKAQFTFTPLCFLPLVFNFIYTFYHAKSVTGLAFFVFGELKWRLSMVM